jgi:hypothetical protein
MPPPAIRRIMPKKIAIPQQITPAMDPPFFDSFVVARAMILIINPIPAKGMFIQFRDPKHGKKAVNIPQIAKIPQTKLNVCILSPFPVYMLAFQER